MRYKLIFVVEFLDARQLKYSFLRLSFLYTGLRIIRIQLNYVDNHDNIHWKKGVLNDYSKHTPVSGNWSVFENAKNENLSILTDFSNFLHENPIILNFSETGHSWWEP